MDDKNYREYQELLEKWKNFSKVYDAIHRAYQLGYEKGIEDEKYCQKMTKAESMCSGMISIESLREAANTIEKTILEVKKIIDSSKQ